MDRLRRELPRPRADLQPLSRRGRGWRGTPIGLLPSLGEEGIDTEGLGVDPEAIGSCSRWTPRVGSNSFRRCTSTMRNSASPRLAVRVARAAGRAPAHRLSQATEPTALDELPSCPTPRADDSLDRQAPGRRREDSEVYVNGVRQQPDIDFCLDRRELIFDRALRRDHVSGRRWLLGPWDMGTYRQDHTVDIPIRSERRNASRTRNADRA